MAIVVGGGERDPKSTDLAFRDPLSETTRKVRTQLLYIATFAVLVKVYDLRINKTPWLDIEVPSTAPQLLDGVLSVAVAYLFFTFLLYAFLDFRRWRVSGEINLLQASFDLILHTRNDLFAMKQHLDKVTSGSPIVETVRKAVMEAAERVPDSQAKLVALRKNLASLTRLQWFRLMVIEIGAPTLLGSIAVAKTWAAVGPFVASVF